MILRREGMLVVHRVEFALFEWLKRYGLGYGQDVLGNDHKWNSSCMIDTLTENQTKVTPHTTPYSYLINLPQNNLMLASVASLSPFSYWLSDPFLNWSLLWKLFALMIFPPNTCPKSLFMVGRRNSTTSVVTSTDTKVFNREVIISSLIEWYRWCDW